jgi:ADP-heptose:LPS heptosyltransferase
VQKVFAVRSLEEASAILKACTTLDSKTILLRIFVRGWVTVANMILAVLRFIMFKKQGYKTRNFKNVIAYTVGIVGDNVVMLPALAALRRRYQDAHITVITNCQTWDQRGAREVLEPSPYKDRLIILDDPPVKRNGFKFEMDKDKFKDIKCDLFVNLSPFGNRGWFGAVVREMIFAKKLGAQYAIGFCMSTYSRRGIFNKVQHYFIKNEPRRSEEVLHELGVRPIENQDLFSHDNAVKEAVLKKIIEWGSSPASLFVINPGAKFKTQCWPVQNFIAAANWLLQNYNATVAITGIVGEREIAEAIVKGSRGLTINLAGETTIQELVELLRMAKACITNDTGTMHIAAMTGTKTVAIFTTRHSPTHWLPKGDKVISIFSPLDCQNCYDDFCETRECLKAISVEDVTKALEEVLSEGK